METKCKNWKQTMKPLWADWKREGNEAYTKLETNKETTQSKFPTHYRGNLKFPTHI